MCLYSSSINNTNNNNNYNYKKTNKNNRVSALRAWIPKYAELIVNK